MAWKITRLQAAGAAGLALLIFIPPFHSTVSTDLVLEPGRIAPLHAEAGGKVSQVFVRQGDEVKPGQLLAILEDPEIRAKAQIVAAQLALASSNLRHNEGSDPEKTAQAARERSRWQRELAVAQKEVESLEIHATFAGIITTPEVEQKVGAYLSRGDEFCRVVDRSTMRARILVRDWELEDVRPGTPVKAIVLPFPYRINSGHVDQILPAAAEDRPVAQPHKLERMGQELTNYFAVIVEFPNPDGSLREGMTGIARINAKRSPLASKVGRESWRWLRSQVW